MGWAVDSAEVISLVGRPVEVLNAVVMPGRRLILLSADGSTPQAVAKTLVDAGFGLSKMSVLSDLGSAEEQRLDGTAADWEGTGSPLNVVAVHCIPDPDTLHFGRYGLPDELFESDGQITKRDVRAMTLARLAPVPGELLWDVGAGSGSVAIEWMRTDTSCRAIAIELHTKRAERVTRNAKALGTPGIRVVIGHAPDALANLETPDAIFIGGGANTPGVIDRCWEALPPRGRLVVNAVTIESEAALVGWQAKLGGDLVRVSISHASPLGGFSTWRPALPVTLWTVHKGVETQT